MKENCIFVFKCHRKNLIHVEYNTYIFYIYIYRIIVTKIPNFYQFDSILKLEMLKEEYAIECNCLEMLKRQISEENVRPKGINKLKRQKEMFFFLYLHTEKKFICYGEDRKPDGESEFFSPCRH